MQEGWKPREYKGEPYKRRHIPPAPKTKLEYGERTWTTAQTARDLIQNPLDAETERYYKDMVALVIDGEKFKERLDACSDTAVRGLEEKKLNDALYAAFLFSRHAEDMGPRARAESEEFLKEAFRELPICEDVATAGVFDPACFLGQVAGVAEHLPYVSYDIFDTHENKATGVIPRDELQNEPMYQERNVDGEFRYRIDGMKVVDEGSGYDSQFTSLYFSSKFGKSYLRGKHGEGIKMSELHSLRHGAKIKMRSLYNVETEDGEKSRLWQGRPKEEDGNLAIKGVEIEKSGSGDTGSMFHIDLRNAGEEFAKEMRDTIDPRTGGLSDNVIDFGEKRFVYPLPVSADTLVGVNMSGRGDKQFVQGLRVETQADPSRETPWFSYDTLDSNIIVGRDRNELTQEVNQKIASFWGRIDDSEMIRSLVRVAVRGREGEENNLLGGPEMYFLDSVMLNQGKEDRDEKEQERFIQTQKVIDQAILETLEMEKDVPTLVISREDASDIELKSLLGYATANGYRIATVAAPFSLGGIFYLAKRTSAEGYSIFSHKMLKEKKEKEDSQREVREKMPFIEGQREKVAREIFASAVVEINAFLKELGMKEFGEFSLQFRNEEDLPPFPKQPNFKGLPLSNRFELSGKIDGDTPYNRPPILDNFGIFGEVAKMFSGKRWNSTLVPDSNILPLQVNHLENVVWVTPSQLPDPVMCPSELQRVFEVCLLSQYGAGDYRSVKSGLKTLLFEEKFDEGMETMAGLDSRQIALRRVQGLLDEVLEDMIPFDSPVLREIPDHFDYTQLPGFYERVSDEMKRDGDLENALLYKEYTAYLEGVDPELSPERAKEMCREWEMDRKNNPSISVLNTLYSRVFLKDGILTYHDQRTGDWTSEEEGQRQQVSEWKGYPVFRLADERFFVALPFAESAVLSRGEGKHREYIFNEGVDFLRIGGKVERAPFGGDFSMWPQRDGLVLRKSSTKSVSESEYVQERLADYSFFPVGVATEQKKDFRMVEGEVPTAMSVEYGQNEWDKPIRAFQDVVQNHIDAGIPRQRYEVEREGTPGRVWITAEEIKDGDRITGYEVSDDGDGYAPNDIATIGASSKRSPLYAGKYGEGQKVVAAACLRNGLEIEYSSVVETEEGVVAWKARAVKRPVEVVKDSRPIIKDFVSFGVTSDVPGAKKGSRTIIRVPEGASLETYAEWGKWVPIIDPREKDKKGDGGMSRYVRQLRVPAERRECKIGCITLLLDEPGTVWENGLRINPEAEAGRPLPFGIDVPEVVTTRERNSYDSERLSHYLSYALSQTTDPNVIEVILRGEVDGKFRLSHSPISNLENKYGTAFSVWKDIARKIWPGYMVDYKRRNREEKEVDSVRLIEHLGGDREERQQLEKDFRIEANLAHLDRNRILVLASGYHIFKKFFPSVEDFVDRLESETVPVVPELHETLSRIVAECAKVYLLAAEHERTMEKYASLSPLWFIDDDKKMAEWTDAQRIAGREKGVRVAPITSAFHGKADQGVVLNESLLFERNPQKIAEVTIHELLHLFSQQADYTLPFVSALYSLTRYFRAQKKESQRSLIDFIRGWKA